VVRFLDAKLKTAGTFLQTKKRLSGVILSFCSLPRGLQGCAKCLVKLKYFGLASIPLVQVKLDSDAKGTWLRMLVILAVSVSSIVVLSLVGVLLIQAIILVGYFATIPAILTFEKYSARKRFHSGDLSADERWVVTKMDLEKIQKQVDKCKDEAEKKSLHSSLHFLENKLRRLEWSIRESDLTQMYNAGKGKMDRVADENNSPSVPSTPKDPSKLHENSRDKDAEDGEDGNELNEYESRTYLVKTLLDARAVLRNEPSSTLRFVLKPSANNLRAHYNALRRSAMKKSDPATNGILSDYWACWVLLHAVSNNLPLEPNLPKYCSSAFRPKVVAFIKLVNSMGLAASQT
jgi:hypothetical protein